MNIIYKILLLSLLFLPGAYATHLMGGEIRAVHISGQTFRISVHVYLDLVNGSNAADVMQTVNVCFGDGSTSELPRSNTTRLPDFPAAVAIFEKTYTFSSSGKFQISASVSSRSPYLNLPNAISENLFLWTVIDTYSPNNSPILPYPLIAAGVKQVFAIDLKPLVADNDSISISLQTVSKPSPGTCGVRSLQTSFFYPNDLTKNGTFKVDSKNKKLVWNAPELAGNYVYAFIVNEWRDGIIISQSYHEGTIVVTDRSGEAVSIPQYEPAGAFITSVPISTLASPEISMKLDAYPIPTEDILNFKVYSKKRSNIKVQLINLQGKVLKEISSKEQAILFEEAFDIHILSKGIYILKASNELESVSQKIIR